MDAQLYALVYVSQAVRPFGDDELDALLAESRRYNEARDITGFLAYERPDDGAHPGTFVQRLEGPRGAVQDVFDSRIVTSSRHRQVEVKLHGPISSRTFANWTMAFARLGGGEPEGFNELVQRLGPPPA